MEKLKSIENVSFEGKEKGGLPKGAKILKKSCSISVKEIENGFILRKSYDIKYSLNKNTDYLYYTKEVYSEDNPIEIKQNTMLADLFD